MADQVAVAVSGGGAVAGLRKRFFNHIQKDFLINVWVYLAQAHVAFSDGRRLELLIAQVLLVSI